MFWQQIQANKVRTFVLMVVFFLLVSAVGWALGYYFTGENNPGLILIALVVAGVGSSIAYYNSDKMVLSMAGARAVTREEAPYLYDTVEGLTLAAQLPMMPKLYIIDSPALNAFATGRDPKHAAVAVTSGILQALNREELEGVLAHEMSHILNYDMLVMTVATIFAGAIGLVGNIFGRSMMYGGGRRRSNSNSNNGGNPIMLVIAILLIVVAPVIAMLLKMATSRSREYLADASGARLTRNPDALASALAKISGDPNAVQALHPAVAPLMINDPPRRGNLEAMWSTHPPIEERIRRLLAM